MNVNGYEIKPGAYLYKANLKGADLYGADLYDANLEGANLKGTILEEKTLDDKDAKIAELEEELKKYKDTLRKLLES